MPQRRMHTAMTAVRRLWLSRFKMMECAACILHRVSCHQARRRWVRPVCVFAARRGHAVEVFPLTPQMLNITFSPSVEDRNRKVWYDVTVLDVHASIASVVGVQAIGGTSALRLLELRDDDGVEAEAGVVAKVPVKDTVGWLVLNNDLSLSASTHVTSTGLDFGCIKVRTVATGKVLLHNRGMLPATFHVQTDDMPECFSVDPVHATVPGDGVIPLVLTFTPVEADVYVLNVLLCMVTATLMRCTNLSCRVHRPTHYNMLINWTLASPEEGGPSLTGPAKGGPGSIPASTLEQFARTPDLMVKLQGEGGYPNVHIRDEAVEFVPAMLYCQTKRQLRLYNNGSAEAMVRNHVAFLCVCVCVSALCSCSPVCCTMPCVQLNVVPMERDQAAALMGSAGAASPEELGAVAAAQPDWPLTVDPADTFIVKPNSYRDVTVIFCPQSMDAFEASLLVHLLGEEGDASYMQAKVVASVDSPLLSVQVRTVPWWLHCHCTCGGGGWSDCTVFIAISHTTRSRTCWILVCVYVVAHTREHSPSPTKACNCRTLPIVVTRAYGGVLTRTCRCHSYEAVFMRPKLAEDRGARPATRGRRSSVGSIVPPQRVGTAASGTRRYRPQSAASTRPTTAGSTLAPLYVTRVPVAGAGGFVLTTTCVPPPWQ